LNGVACKNRCEGEVLALNVVLEQSKSAFSKTSAVYVTYSIWLGFGAALLSLGAVLDRKIAVPGALLFLLGACLSYSSGRKFKKREV